MLRLLISAVILLGAHSLGVCAGADSKEEDVVRALLAKRNMRCPTASSCDQATKGSLALTIAFASGSARLTDSANLEIQRFVARYRAQMPDKPTITLSGYTDGVGAEDYNRRLSLRRAVAVSRILIDKFGLPAEAIKVTAHGIRQAGRRTVSPEDRIVVISTAPHP